ncbi:ROK family protein [Streptomyces sp. NPDC092296]|uniref:ROK family transcriptional regulator n=1 Tax=Streptomyces sp. NPDC092296 TaxID=3366012 RepID=UPI00381F7723
MPERTLQTVRDLRRSNRSLLLRRLYFGGPLSRQELIHTTGLSAASVSNVVTDLIEDGLVVEAGALESEGGRPRILLRVNSAALHVIGVDVGETRVRVELFGLDLEEMAGTDLPLDPDGFTAPEVVARIRAGLETVTSTAVAPPGTALLGIGIGVPGVVQHSPDAVVHGQTNGWDAVPLERMLREVTDLPLFIDNGAVTMGQAEMWFGAGRGSRNTVVALIGSGVGASVVTAGAPYRGSTSSAGEWGHTTIQVGGRRCRCGSRGCLEAYIGAESVISRYLEVVDDPAVRDAPDEESALTALLERRGTDAADTVLDATAVHIGAGVANLINLFNPERIVIGGWAGLMLGDTLLPRIRETAREYALHHPFSQTRITLGDLGPDAVTRGAATLPVAHFIAAGGKEVRTGTTAESPVGG